MIFIKLYERALFLKYFNVKLHINTKYFGETLEGTGQAEDYRLKLSPKKASQQYSIVKKPVNEFIINSFTGYLLGIMSQPLFNYLLNVSFKNDSTCSGDFALAECKWACF